MHSVETCRKHAFKHSELLRQSVFSTVATTLAQEHSAISQSEQDIHRNTRRHSHQLKF